VEPTQLDAERRSRELGEPGVATNELVPIALALAVVSQRADAPKFFDE
jgi:hypothetical protein